MRSNTTLKSRVRGCMLGVMIGDAAGRTQEIRGHVNGNIIGAYTDDTQMTMALADYLTDMEEPVIDLVVLAQYFAEYYDPSRCYGGNAGRILSDIKRGVPWHLAVAKHKYPGGSWGNGAAMRVAPIGIMSSDAQWVAEQTARQCNLTGHTHADAVYYAKQHAGTVSTVLHSCLGMSFNWVRNGELSILGGAHMPAPLRWVVKNLGASPEDAARDIGCGSLASESVPCAIWAFLSAGQDGPEAVVRRAIAIGGDMDTIGSMAGALAGAYWGEEAWPKGWVNNLENGDKGRDFLLTLADQLHDKQK